LYGRATVAQFFVSGRLGGMLEERRTQKMIDSYTAHFIGQAARATGVRCIEREAADDEVRAGAAAST
jgi:hypothetical protein